MNLCNYDRATNGVDYYLDAHLASVGSGPFRWLAGATYLRFDEGQLNLISSSFPLSYLSPLAPSFIPFFFDTAAGGHVTTQSYAFYTDLRWQLDQTWAVTGQVRYNDTTRKATEVLEIPQFGIDVPKFPNALHNSFVPFKIGLEGQMTRASLVYLSYATAYKDGTINLGSLQMIPVKPEEVQTWEAGFKTSLLDRRLQVNGAGFHTDYKDLQVQQVLQASAVLTNVPKSTINGAELDMIATPLRGLELILDAGYLDARFDQFENSPNVPGLLPGPLENLSGHRLPYVAPFSINPRISYEFRPLQGYHARLGADYSIRGRTYFDEYNTRINSQGAVGIADLYGSIGPEEKSWQLFFFLNNLTNETVQSGATVYAGTLGASRAVSYQPPRTFGIGASYSF